VEYFLIYLTQFRSPSKKVLVSARVADQYISHVIKFLLDNQWITSRAAVRSDRSRDIVRGLIRTNSSHAIASRLRCRIPCTFHIMLEALNQASLRYSIPSAGPTCLAIRGALALGYALSLRPQEYLAVRATVPLWKRAHSSLAFFWFPGLPTPYSVCSPHAYPAGLRPSAFTLFLDFNKNHQDGDAGPRSMAPAPPHAPFCCLLMLFEFLVAYPPLPDSPLLSGSPVPISPAVVTAVFTRTALALGLDPTRLVPHSLRGAALSQMIASAAFTDIDLLTQGRWKSSAGIRPYAHTSLAHATRVTPSLYDPLAHPLAETLLTFRASPY
jgi:hypothetical protein